MPRRPLHHQPARAARRIAWAVGCAALGTASVTVAAPLPLGTATVVAGPAACGDDDCYTLAVSCPEVAVDVHAELRVGAPTGAPRGTLLFTTGGGGTGFWGSSGHPARVLRELRQAGFATVELSWPEPWLVAAAGEEAGHARLACRPATVAIWVHESLHDDTLAFCASGNSGGAAQLSYLLARYGLEDRFAAVVPTGGPPMGRIDLGCLHENPRQQRLWYAPGSASLIDQGFGFLDGDGPCRRGDAAFRQAFRDASVVQPAGDYVYPHTTVWFLFGALDRSNAVAQGLAYFRRLAAEDDGGPVHREVVPGTGHAVAQTAQGANRIRDVLLASCRR